MKGIGDYMTGNKGAKEWLNRVWKINEEIRALQDLRDETWAQVTSITAVGDGVVVQGYKNPHKYDRLVELDDKINRHIDKLIGTKQEVMTAIMQVKDRRYRTILLDRYLRNNTWEQIAVDAGYNIRHIWRLHGEALQAVAVYIKQ